MMTSDGYLRLAAEWDVRAGRDPVRCATGCERAEGTGSGGNNGVERIAGRDSRSTLGSGANLGSGATIGSGATLGGETTLGSG